MLIEHAPAATRSHRPPRWLWISGACVFGVLIVGIVILATHWPFTREAVTRALEKATSRPVEIGGFHRSYFPPGCMAENVRILHNTRRDAPPLVTIERLMIQGSFLGMFTSPKRLAEVKVAGMHVVVPPKGSHWGTGRIVLNSGSDSLAIAKIVADHALLEFLPAKSNDQPYRLRIDALKLTGVGSGKPMAYDAILTNSEPPGVIHSQGNFGPWNPEDPGVTPVSGDFTYRDVNLGVFRSISGILQAKGKFRGLLGRIEAEGSTEIPDFHVENSGSTVRVTTVFRAIVNGTNGDTRLDPVEAHFLRTTLIVRGPIADGHGEKGKTATLQLSVPKGRIDDILRLFVEEKSAPLSGAVRLDGTFLWPPGPAEFLKKIRMDLGFGIDGGRFRSEVTQGAIDHISKSAQGESKDEAEEDPRTTLSDLRGSVAFRHGVATFRGVSFRVPGASAAIRGTYGLTDHRVDLHGVLTTTGKLSDATSGFKAFILKALTPFFKKKHDVKVVPFKITGTLKDASVSLD